MKTLCLILYSLLFCLAGCSLVSQLGGASPQTEETLDSDEEEIQADTDPILETNLEDEEEVFENPDEIANLISTLTSEDQSKTEDSKLDEQKTPSITKPNVPPHKAYGFQVPTAVEIWNMTDEQCMSAIADAGLSVVKPDFDTPFVKTPLLLKSKIEGVKIEPRWPRQNPVNAVMDCRLILALVNVARQAAEYDVEEVLFYSTYRPLNIPDKTCPSGKKGKKCRARKKAYEKAKKGKMSQHRRASAIDIRWFKRKNGDLVDVLEHYERNDKSPPCSDSPKTDHGKFLKEFACELHRKKTFNVILTPNANKDHHNHFHMDITPGAGWYIIR